MNVITVIRRIWSFHVVGLLRTAKKCTKNYNVRAEPLFCSLHLSFSNVPIAVAVMVFLSSLVSVSDVKDAVFLFQSLEQVSRCKELRFSGKYLFLEHYVLAGPLSADISLDRITLL